MDTKAVQEIGGHEKYPQQSPPYREVMGNNPNALPYSRRKIKTHDRFL